MTQEEVAAVEGEANGTEEEEQDKVEEEEAPRRGGRKTAPTPKSETPKPRSKRGQQEDEVGILTCLVFSTDNLFNC